MVVPCQVVRPEIIYIQVTNLFIRLYSYINMLICVYNSKEKGYDLKDQELELRRVLRLPQL